MARLRIPAALMLALMTPFSASALEITNLDSRPHTVRFDSAGTSETVQIEAGDTALISAQPNGFLSLETAAEKRDGGNVNADGILSGVLAAARNQRVPAETWDAFVIWPDGTFAMQQRWRGGRRGGN